MRLGAQRDPPRGLAHQPRGKLGRGAPSGSRSARSDSTTRTEPSARSDHAAVAILGRAKRAASASRRRRTANRRVAPRASGLGALSMCSDRNRPAPSPRAIAGPLLERQIAVVCRGSRRRGPGRARPAGREARGRGPASGPFRRSSPETRGRARIAAAMAGVDQHDRAPGGPGLADRDIRRRPARSRRSGCRGALRRSGRVRADGRGGSAAAGAEHEQRRRRGGDVTAAPASLRPIVELVAIPL